METPVADHLDAVVADYLRRLDASAAPLGDDRRVELVGEIAEHIAQARAAGAVTGEAGLRDLLDRLGEPDDIVAAARDDEPVENFAPPQPTWQYKAPGIGLEIAAVLLMTVGSVLPFVGWVVGAVLLWSSRRFRVGEKLLMTLVFPGGPFLFIGLAFVLGGQVCRTGESIDSFGNTFQGPQTCSGFAFPIWLGIPVLVVSLIAPFVIGGLLIKRVGDRARSEPPVPVPVAVRWPGAAATTAWAPLEIAAVLLLSVGSLVLPFVGPVAGLVCAWMSTAWTTAEKWVATAIVGLAVVIPLAAFVALWA